MCTTTVCDGALCTTCDSLWSVSKYMQILRISNSLAHARETLLYIDQGSFTLAEMFSFSLKIVPLLASVNDPQSCHDQSYLATQD